MKVFVNFPEDEEGIKEFQKASNMFLATLIVESIKSMNIDNMSKKKVFDKAIEILKNDTHDGIKSAKENPCIT